MGWNIGSLPSVFLWNIALCDIHGCLPSSLAFSPGGSWRGAARPGTGAQTRPPMSRT
jgi:hypothetical protein